ncbi:hypothetical protein ACYSNU_17675 [Enterococcus sp. LJL120]
MWTGDQYDKWLSDPECYAFVNVSADEDKKYLTERYVEDEYGDNTAFERDDTGQFIEDNNFVFLLKFSRAEGIVTNELATDFSIGDLIQEYGYTSLNENIQFLGIGSVVKKYLKEIGDYK